jgi:hypothetical protein
MEQFLNFKRENTKMLNHIILPSIILCALPTLAAGRDYRDDYGRSDHRQHQQVRKAPEQEVDTETLKLAMRLEELKIKRAKQERELEKEKARTAEAQARAASAIARSGARASSGHRKLPTHVSEWTPEDADVALI